MCTLVFEKCQLIPDEAKNEIAPKYEGRVGGYTRILKAGPRRGDNAEVVILQLV